MGGSSELGSFDCGVVRCASDASALDDRFSVVRGRSKRIVEPMSLKAKLEAIIYAAETPVTLDQLIELVKDSVISDGAANGTEVKSRVRLALEALIVDYYSPDHGIEIRQVAGGYRMSTKPEHHDIVMLRFCRHPVSAGDLANFDTMIRAVVIDDQCLESETHPRFDLGAVGRTVADHGILDQFNQLIQRDRCFRCVDNGFEFGFKAHGFDDSLAPTAHH